MARVSDFLFQTNRRIETQQIYYTQEAPENSLIAPNTLVLHTYFSSILVGSREMFLNSWNFHILLKGMSFTISECVVHTHKNKSKHADKIKW